MTLALDAAVKQARSTAIFNAINAGAGPGLIKFYSAPRPVTGAEPTGTLLGTITLTDPCGTVDNVGLHLVAEAVTQAIAGGVITWARVTDSADNFVFDGDVRDASAPDIAIADFLIDSQVVYAGGFLVLASAVLAEGG